MPVNARQFITAAILAVTLAAPNPAFAGPPLLCHPFEIGTAASLPWSGSASWHDGRAGYSLDNLVRDTEALLGAAAPVIARMETLRRAAIYASRDPKIASALLDRLTARARTAPRPDALALLDLAYATEALRQIALIGGIPGHKAHVAAIRDLVRDRDGWKEMTASLAARPDDPALEFAAALIAADKNRGAYLAHAQRARAGASRDALLARNLGHISS
jgi:hypothetical protein